jgi:hypothetical protein
LLLLLLLLLLLVWHVVGWQEAKLAEELKKRPGKKKRELRYRKRAAAGEGYEEGSEDSM